MERDSILQQYLQILTNFNSHAHVERDLHVQSLAEQPTDFNSHAHVERDGKISDIKQGDLISTHTLTWSVTWEDFDFTLTKLNFNSHAHVERDNVFINF